jgi:hypothetical protein
MERTGIEPVTSGLQIQSTPSLRMSGKGTPPKASQLGNEAWSVLVATGRRDLTRI